MFNSLPDSSPPKPSFDSNTNFLTTLDPACQPRRPWQDVHSSIEGPAVFDLLRNLGVRFNSVSGFPSLPMPPLPLEIAPRRAHIQVLRSAPARRGGTEARLRGNSARKRNGTEDHIQRAIIDDKQPNFHVYTTLLIHLPNMSPLSGLPGRMTGMGGVSLEAKHGMMPERWLDLAVTTQRKPEGSEASQAIPFGRQSGTSIPTLDARQPSAPAALSLPGITALPDVGKALKGLFGGYAP